MSTDWRDTCDYLDAFLASEGPNDQFSDTSLKLMVKDKKDIMEPLLGVSIVLVQRLAHAQGAVGADEINLKARDIIQQLSLDPPPGWYERT